MRLFLYKCFILALPIILLSINYLSFQKSGGDLNRIGKISIDQNYRMIFFHEFTREIKYKNISQNKITKNDTIDILTMGDSFSNTGSYGFQNYLVANSNFKVYNIESKFFQQQNQVQAMFSYLNSGLFDTIHVKYLLLQCVVRNFVWKGAHLNENDSTKLNLSYNPQQSSRKTSDFEDLGYFRNIWDYFIYNVLFQFDDNAFYSQVFKYKVNKKLFSASNQLLFYQDDIQNIYEPLEIKLLNATLNKLADKLKTKNIKLLVLPCPDKYDMYYDFIIDNQFPKNPFFETMKTEIKNYTYIDVKDFFLKKIEQDVLDIYFVDDTHWSPVGHQLIAKEITEVVMRNTKQLN